MYHVEKGKIEDRNSSQEAIETVEDTRNVMAGESTGFNIQLMRGLKERLKSQIISNF